MGAETLVSKKAPKTIRLRHYTNNKGISGIKNDGVIKASDQNKVFNTRAKGKLSQRDAEKKFGLDRGRGNNYVEYDATMDEIEIINNRTTGAREYNIKGVVDLLERNPEYFKNR